MHDARWLDNEQMNPLYAATVSAVEESIVEGMLASPTMRGADDLVVPGLPADRLVAALRRFGRMP